MKIIIWSHNSPIFKSWKEPPYEIHFDFFLWNLTNPNEVRLNGAKPNYSQVGPFAYDYFLTRLYINTFLLDLDIVWTIDQNLMIILIICIEITSETKKKF